jgi:hypothetical protein
MAGHSVIDGKRKPFRAGGNVEFRSVFEMGEARSQALLISFRPKANPSTFSGYVAPRQLHLFTSRERSRVCSVTPSRRIEDRIRNLSQKLLQTEENTNEFEAIAAELRFALFTLEWQISTRLKNFPPELDRRSRQKQASQGSQ